MSDHTVEQFAARNKLYNYHFKSGNYIDLVDSVEKIAESSDILLTALEEFNNPRKSNLGEAKEVFIKKVMWMATHFPESNIPMLRSRNDKPLGFIMCLDGTSHFEPELGIMHVYGAYSTGRYKDTIEEILEWELEFCKLYDYNVLSACGMRFTGSARYWFEEKMGFKRRSIEYRRHVV